MTPKLTWTFGIRDTYQFQSAEPASTHVARLRGSFDSISHDVNQPLNAAIQTRLGNCSLPRRSRFFNRERRLPGSSNRIPCFGPASESSATSCRAASPT